MQTWTEKGRKEEVKGKWQERPGHLRGPPDVLGRWTLLACFRTGSVWAKNMLYHVLFSTWTAFAHAATGVCVPAMRLQTNSQQLLLTVAWCTKAMSSMQKAQSWNMEASMVFFFGWLSASSEGTGLTYCHRGTRLVETLSSWWESKGKMIQRNLNSIDPRCMSPA